jgi:O-antigen biosynthesis protein
MLFSKSIDLLEAPFSKSTWSTSGDRVEAKSTYRIRIDVARGRLNGWYRIKFKTPGTTMVRLLIKQAAFDARVRSAHIGGFIFVDKNLDFIEVQIDCAAHARLELIATLRPVIFLEQIWLARRHYMQVRPRELLSIFRPEDPVRFDFKFGGPRDAFSEGTYQHWIRVREPSAHSIVKQRLNVTRAELPSVSILMPVCDPLPRFLNEAIQSAVAQSSRDWQLCIADDASQNSEIRQIIREAAHDRRVNFVFRDQRGNIAAATNSAFALARHPYAICLDHDDLLARPAIELLSRFVSVHPNTEFLYSDEDKIDAQGRRHAPTFKPEFSPDLIHSYNYINHIAMYRSQAIREVGGWRSAFDGAQDYDLNLRIIERTSDRNIRHLPLVLYHWRAIPGSTAFNLDAKPWASEAGRAALQDHLDRSLSGAQALIHRQTLYRVAYPLPKPEPRVSIIIPTRDQHTILKACVQSILNRSTYRNFDILIVDNGSTEEESRALLTMLELDPRITVLREPGPFNYSALNNRAVRATDAPFICFLNNDTQVVTPEWLSELVSYACRPGTGCVGPRLLYDDQTVQHAGVVLGLGRAAGHVFTRTPRDGEGTYARSSIACNYSALTGACLLMRRELFLAAGGFDEEQLPVVFGDIDLCIKVRNLGFYHVFTPFAELFHYESFSRGPDNSPEKLARFNQQRDAFIRRYHSQLRQDPCYSPHFSLNFPYAIDMADDLDTRITI